MRDIKDWCISRQQWWGHRIPAWYDDDGNVYVGDSEAAVRAEHKLAPDLALRQDDDVLETWFSSALWSFATLGWPEKTEELAKYHPTDVLVTGHDIIFFWVARMIMMTLHFTGEVPFKKVYMTGLVRDELGQKMSKTKGNGIDPLDLIEGITLDALVEKRTSNLTQPQMAKRIEKNTRKDFPEGIESYGTDALRFTLCALASSGRNVKFDMGRIEGYRNFCNKLWNASKFVLMNLDETRTQAAAEPSLIDRWILSRASKMLQDVELAFETYRFDMLANVLYEFIWHEFCDWYIELLKPVLWDTDGDQKARAGAQQTLLSVLDLINKAAHPIMPYITAALWQQTGEHLGEKRPTLMLEAYPRHQDFASDPDAEAAVDWLKGVIEGVRNIRGEANIKPGQEIALLLQGGTEQDQVLADSNGALLSRLAKLSSVGWLPAGDQPPPHALALVGELRVMVPLAGLIDVGEESARLNKEIDKREQDLKRIQGKLSNEKFVSKAPDEVVEKERQKASDHTAAIATLKEQLASLEALA